MYTIQKIEQEVLKSLKTALGKQYVPNVDELGNPPDPKWGDLTFPCFSVAKGLNRPPAEIASELAPKIEPGGFIAKVEARGPYVNFYVEAGVLANHLLKETELLTGKYGTWTTGDGKQVMVEYAGLNTHKAAHVGHVRSMVLGQAIVNLLRAIGYKVIAAGGLHGDTGTHVATTLWGLQKFYANEMPPKTGRGLWLNKIYTEATQWLEKHPEKREEMLELGRKLEAGDKTLVKLWKQTRRWSIKELDEIFKELGLKLDCRFYDSEMEAEGRKIVAELLRKGIAKVSEGAMIVPLDEYGLGAFMILKSDGSSLYATHDLALAKKKFSEYELDRSIHVVDSRQSLHFKQLFKTLELMGFKKPSFHVAYEFVTLKEGAISSRKGNIISYEDLRDAVVTAAAEETQKRHPNWSAARIKRASWDIAFSAIKFSMLMPDINRVIVFDIKSTTSFDGNTGPYLQYTGARISSILKKSQKEKEEVVTLKKTTAVAATEKDLLLAVARFPEVVLKSAQEMRPTPLAEYLFFLAKKFSEFYEAVPILKAAANEQKFRLALIRSVRTVLVNGAAILGFEIPKEM